MQEPIYSYDETSDTLTITFAPGEHATGIELTDHILLRMNMHEQRAVGVTLFDYSVLIQPTEMGPRSFPLIGLRDLPADIREIVLHVLQQPPVRDVLLLSAYTPSLAETTPIVAIQPIPTAADPV